MIFIECFGKLPFPYDFGYQKKHIRPYGGGWGLLLYKWLAEFFFQGQNDFLLVFAVVHHTMASDVFSIIVGYQDEHLHNIIVQFFGQFSLKNPKSNMADA